MIYFVRGNNWENYLSTSEPKSI